MPQDLTEYRERLSKLTGGDIIKLRDATSRIQRISADYRNQRLNESAAIELVRQIIEYLEPTLQLYNRPFMLWPQPVRELLQAIQQSGFTISFVENMFLQQELTARLAVRQPMSTNTELVDAINQERTETIAAAMENVLQKCMNRLKINLDTAKQRLIFREHIHDADGNIFFVLLDKETNQEVSKRIYYKELLDAK